MAELGSISLHTQHRWEAGGGLPSTEYLFRVDEAGGDMVWILTGRSLNPDEDEVLRLRAAYDMLPADLREALVTYGEAMAAYFERMHGHRPGHASEMRLQDAAQTFRREGE